jgi:biopolymer transport protein ExbB/biopolymer transport protein TolQ
MQFTLSDLWSHMGLFARLIVFALGLMSMASMLVAVERLIALRKSRKDSFRFIAEIGPFLGRGDVDGAAAAVVTREGYIGRVVNAGLKAWRGSSRVDSDLTFESVARSLERGAQREIQLMKRGLGVLGTVSSTAPFVGLLGTVMGIVNSFQAMAASGSGGLGTVSAGIAEALITTAFGLLVAIPSVMMFNYFTGWIDARAVDMSESSNEFLDLVAVQLKSEATSRFQTPLAPPPHAPSSYAPPAPSHAPSPLAPPSHPSGLPRVGRVG